MGRHLWRWSLVASAFCFGTLAVVLSDPALSTEPEPAKTAAARVLESHCARCHQADRLQGTKPETLLLNILELDELARDSSLVRPGVADASPLYTVMLRQAMPPPSAGDGAAFKPVPSDEEIQAVRDWINGLTHVAQPRCTSTAAAEDMVSSHLSRLSPVEGAESRFIFVPCAAIGSKADRRQVVQRLISHVAHSSGAGEAELLDAEGSLFRLSLSSTGITAEVWEELVAAYPDRTLPASPATKLASGVTQSAVSSIRGDWLAHALMRGLVPITNPLTPDAILQLAPLARSWERDVDLEVAAAELSLDPHELAQRLASVPERDQIAARRLLQGLLPREDFQKLRSLLLESRETPAAETGGVQQASAPFSFAIWSDKTSYAVGDLLTLNAATNTDCHLTLIGLETNGQATVLFPNEMETDNMIKAGSIPHIPGAEASYQFRLDKPGTETVIGVCTVHAKIADNIQQDFDNQRFTLLGDWRDFLAKTWKQSAKPTSRQQTDRRRRQSRAARNNPSPPPVERPKPEEHVRMAITLEVK